MTHRRIKVLLSIKRETITYNMQAIMTLDTPTAGDFVFHTQAENSDFSKVERVFHRDEHYPLVMLEPIDHLNADSMVHRNFMFRLEGAGWQYV